MCKSILFFWKWGEKVKKIIYGLITIMIIGLIGNAQVVSAETIKYYSVTEYLDKTDLNYTITDNVLNSSKLEYPINLDTYKYMLVLTNNYGQKTVVFATSQLTIKNPDNGNGFYMNIPSSAFKIVFSQTNTYIKQEINISEFYWFGSNEPLQVVDYMFYSNYDVYYTDLQGNSSVFFSQPIKNPILVTATQGVQMGQTMNQVVGLIPLLMLLVVGFLALRKALAWLSQTLHQA
jgi:hypothetical protein